MIGTSVFIPNPTRTPVAQFDPDLGFKYFAPFVSHNNLFLAIKENNITNKIVAYKYLSIAVPYANVQVDRVYQVKFSGDPTTTLEPFTGGVTFEQETYPQDTPPTVFPKWTALSGTITITKHTLGDVGPGLPGQLEMKLLNVVMQPIAGSGATKPFTINGIFGADLGTVS